MSLDKETEKILKQMEKRGFTAKEVNKFIDAMERRQSTQRKAYTLGNINAKFGIFGDTHMGNIQFDQKLFDYMIKTFDKENVDYVLCTGDIVDGWYQNRPSSIFEQNAIGFDAQFKLAEKNLKKIEQPLYFITGNHSYNTFVRGAGVEIGNYLEDKLENSTWLGNGEGDIILGGQKIKLLHPDGGTAYAISYRPQKIVESLGGGEKPNMLLIGHYHKAEYIFYRNVHTIQTGTLMGQTKFMRGKSIPAHKGFWIVDVQGKKNGQIDRISPSLYPAYD